MVSFCFTNLSSNKSRNCFIRFGDVYEALKDTERALHLCPTHKKSLRRRVKCLKSLGLLNVASAYLAEYEQLHSEDEDNFVASCKTEIDKQLSEGKLMLMMPHNECVGVVVFQVLLN